MQTDNILRRTEFMDTIEIGGYGPLQIPVQNEQCT